MAGIAGHDAGICGHDETEYAITGALCMAHARRKLFEAHKLNSSQIAAQAVALIARLYEVEREARELEPAQRLLLRQSHAKPIADALHAWLLEKRQTLAKADITAKAVDYSLSNWRPRAELVRPMAASQPRARTHPLPSHLRLRRGGRWVALPFGQPRGG
jgi:hypothetical protein